MKKDVKYAFNIFKIYYLINKLEDKENIPLKILEELNKNYAFFEKNSELDLANPESEKILINWMNNICRYSFLNILLENTIKYLKGKKSLNLKHIKLKDNFLIKNFKPILKMMLNELKLNGSLDYNENINFSPLSNELYNEYIVNLLKRIDPSLKLFNLYEWAKNNNKFISLNEMSEESQKEIIKKYNLSDTKYNRCIYLQDGPIIILSKTNTIKDIPVFMHEFGHFITFYFKKKSLGPTLNEFYSIFYENLALAYLTNKSYSHEEIEYLLNERLLQNKYLLNIYTDFFIYLNYYLDKGKIREEDEVLIRGENFKLLKEKLFRKCDFYISKFFNNPLEFIRVYSYIIGTILSYKAFEMIATDESLLKLFISDSMSSEIINPEDIFNLVGINLNKRKIKRTRLK